MRWKEFFKPTKGKVILPIILVLFFLIGTSLNYYNAHWLGPVLCESETKYLIPIIKATKAHDNATAENLSKEAKQYVKENMISEKVIVIADFFDSNLRRISPFYKGVCLPPSEETRCSYSYFKENDFNCIKSSFKEIYAMADKELEVSEYKPVPWYSFIFNIIYFILAGYILSCLIAFIVNKARSK